MAMSKELKELKTMVEDAKAAEAAAAEATDEKHMSLEERKAEIDNLVKDYNAASADGDMNATTATRTLLDEAVSIYNRQLREAEYDKWLSTDTPVLNALKQGKITQLTIKTKKAEGEPNTLEEGEKGTLVDLIELDKYAGASRKIFISGQWIHKCGHLAKDLTERIARDVENKEARKIIVNNIELTLEEAQALNIKDKLSNNSLKKACQMILDDVIEGYIFTGKDLQYVFQTMSRQSSRELATLVAPRKNTVVKILTNAMHRIVNAKEYGIEFKAKDNIK